MTQRLLKEGKVEGSRRSGDVLSATSEAQQSTVCSSNDYRTALLSDTHSIGSHMSIEITRKKGKQGKLMPIFS